jgi:hypothetical protein
MKIGGQFSLYIFNLASRVVNKIKRAEIWLSNRAKEDIDRFSAHRHRTLLWERHDGIEMKGFPDKYTLWSLASDGANAKDIQLQDSHDIDTNFDPLSIVGQMQEGIECADDVLTSMPQLMLEMRSDLLTSGSKFTREFFVLPNQKVSLWSGSKPRFIYYEDDHQNLQGQINLLETHGFLTNVTPPGNNALIYRMTEKLVSRLCNDIFKV